MSNRLLSYVSKGQPRAGLLVNDAVYDLAAATRNAAWSSVLAVLNDWPKAKAALAKAAKETRAKGLPLAKTKLLAPILYPGNIYCVAGYTIANDVSARDVMRRAGNPPTSPFHYDWVSQKCFDGACPLGPWIVPASEIRDPHNLGIKLWIGDELMQDSNTGQLIFDTAEQIAMLSSRVTLQPGDLVLTGTPAGVGMGRKRFLQPGERVRLWIEGIGELTHSMTFTGS